VQSEPESVRAQSALALALALALASQYSS